MKRMVKRVACAAGLMGSALLAGCQHHGRHCDSCGNGQALPPPAAVMLQRLPAPSVYHEMPHEEDVTVKQVLPPVETAKAPEPPPQDTIKAEEIEQAAYAREIADAKKVIKSRRTFHDITADVCFDHAADYSSVTGELYFEKDSQTWTVRYCSVDDEDRYGGKVTLADVPAMDKYKSGMMVRVEGQVIDPDNAPHYCAPYKVGGISLVRE